MTSPPNLRIIRDDRRSQFYLRDGVPAGSAADGPAAERGIVVLDGGGFDAPNMSVRISLVNLPDEAYEAVGRGISELLADYHERWRSR